MYIRFQESREKKSCSLSINPVFRPHVKERKENQEQDPCLRG
jgi:hypothetical protein